MTRARQKFIGMCIILALASGSRSQDAVKFHGSSYDGYGLGTSASGLTLGVMHASKYYGGSYDGHVQGASASGLILGLLYTSKYYGGSYDGHVQGASASGLILGVMHASKYYGGSCDGHVQSGMSNSLVQVKIYLEGSYNGSTDQMNNTIVVPTTSPYPEDVRTITAIPVDIVDWVLVQLRLASNGFTVASKSALLHKDGRIVADDGSASTISNGGGTGDRYIVVRHRNHLAVMSAAARPLGTGSPSLYDFTTGLGQYYGSNGAKQVDTGVWGMWAGDVNQDKNVTTTDYTSWYNSARLGESGYKTADINMDGVVTTSDYTQWYNNARLGAASPVP